MRHNALGDVYCHTADELREQLEECGFESTEVYLSTTDAPETADEKWNGEITHNSSGELVCYVEADSEDALNAIIREIIQ